MRPPDHTGTRSAKGLAEHATSLACPKPDSSYAAQERMVVRIAWRTTFENSRRPSGHQCREARPGGCCYGVWRTRPSQIGRSNASREFPRRASHCVACCCWSCRIDSRIEARSTERTKETPMRRLMAPVVLIMASLVELGCSGSSPAAEGRTEATLEATYPAATSAVLKPSKDATKTAWRVVDGHLIGEWERVPVYVEPDIPEILQIDDNRVVVVRPSGRGKYVTAYIYDARTGTATPAPSRFPWTSTNTIVWTGKKVFIGPGNNNSFPPPTPPLTYDPDTDVWEQVAIDLPTAERAMSVGDGRGVWTGSEVLYFAAGLALDPEHGTWRNVARFPLTERVTSAAVWTGKDLIVWGGCDASIRYCSLERQGLLTDGAIYSPSSDTWRAMAPSPLPAGASPAAVWTGTNVIFYAGLVAGDTSSAASYDPETDEWTSLPIPPIKPRSGIGLAWSSDTGMLFAWGGSTDMVDPANALSDGVAFDSSAMSWLHLPEAPPRTARAGHTVAAIGEMFYVDGGSPSFGPLILKPQ